MLWWGEEAGTEIRSGEPADDERIPDVHALVPATLDARGHHGFRDAGKRVAVGRLGVDEAHAGRAADAAGSVGDVDVDAEIVLHLGHDQAVEGVGAAAGRPDNDVRDVTFRVVLRLRAGGGQAERERGGHEKSG
jgi:hypothetical protein